MKESENNEIEMIKKIEIPDVIGKTEEQAKKELKNLDVIIKYVNMDSKENGIVLGQSVKPKKIVDEYTVITLKVNKKEEKDNKEKLDKDKLDKEKVMNIIKKAQKDGKITYGELATQLGDVNTEQIEEVFDTFENIGVNVFSE